MTDKTDIDNVRYSFETQEFFQRQIEEAINTLINEKNKEKKEKVHVAGLLPVCVEKNSELPEGDPKRIFKGRWVYRGDDVKDENNEAALFNELGSNPATLEASKAVDMYGRVEGNDQQVSDADQAYTQAAMGDSTRAGDEISSVKIKCGTWVRLPREYWSKGWETSKTPWFLCVWRSMGIRTRAFVGSVT